MERKEKQNEEMADEIYETLMLEAECPLSGMDCAIIADLLVGKGYRKSTDVAEEIFAEIDDFQRTLRHIFLDMCDGNDYNTLNLLQIDSAIEALFDSRIAELKKKYTKEIMGEE